LIQLATEHKAYLFHVNSSTLKFLQPILSNPKQIKVGFGLKNDKHIFHKKGIELESCVDLAKGFSHFGFKQQMGVQKAVALLFGQYLAKSKKSELQIGRETTYISANQLCRCRCLCCITGILSSETKTITNHISQTIQTALQA
jgi:hypothetical protein